MRKLDRYLEGLNKSIKQSTPALVVAYQNACEDVCGVRPYVGVVNHAKFIYRQRTLDDREISYDAYARAVVSIWHTWITSKGMKCVPANMFVGDKSLLRYERMSSTSVKIQSLSEIDEVKALEIEYMLATAYIGRILIGERMSGRDIEAFYKLHDPYLLKKQRPVKKILSWYNRIYGIDAASYKQVAAFLLYGGARHNIDDCIEGECDEQFTWD